MESSSDECVGTTAPSMQTSIRGAISGTPSLQQLLEERTPSTQTVVTRVGFRESFYTVLETTMPRFGSTSGGKSGTASVPERKTQQLRREQSLKRTQIMEPHAPMPATMRSCRGRRPPKEACQTYVPENALHYCLE